MAPNMKHLGQHQSYGKTCFTNVAVSTVPITTPGPANIKTCHITPVSLRSHFRRGYTWPKLLLVIWNSIENALEKISAGKNTNNINSG